MKMRYVAQIEAMILCCFRLRAEKKVVLPCLCLLSVWMLGDSAIAANVCRLQSPDGQNVISIELTKRGRLSYDVRHKGLTVVRNSSLGLDCDDGDFVRGLTLYVEGPRQIDEEKYQLIVGNKLHVDHLLARKSVTFKNGEGKFVRIDLAASSEGVGFRYHFDTTNNITTRTVMDEKTSFNVPLHSVAWILPYDIANRYSPAYENFYYKIHTDSSEINKIGNGRGWCMPALFHSEDSNIWMLIAETGTYENYCACHLDAGPKANHYKIAFPYKDEATYGQKYSSGPEPKSTLPWEMPWRIIIIGENAGDILLSTLFTDLARPCQISDTSWIRPGRASWSWWTHTDGKNMENIYDEFTDFAASFGWEYTLFDAGWWSVDIKAISRYANRKGVKPLVWLAAQQFYDATSRKQSLDRVTNDNIHGIKVDFWCCDRQEAMAAINTTLKKTAERKLVVNLHGCTIPRGWHRTWPNLLTAEAVLGTENYLFRQDYPDRAAKLNTILPFTRNVAGPMDATPFALSMRRYRRKTTAAHELATVIVFTSGIICYAECPTVVKKLPDKVKEVLKEAPASWDETRCLVGEPGKLIVLARRTGKKWFVAGLNGTDSLQTVQIDFRDLCDVSRYTVITEGEDQSMEYNVKTVLAKHDNEQWKHAIPPRGGFVVTLQK